MDEVAEIAYQVHRTQRQAAQHPLILIHGAGGNHLYWPPEIRHLPGFSVYSIDLPGHGRSTTNPRTSIEDYSQALIGWLRALQLSKVILVGHSMGSAIAMQAALDEPELIGVLALLGGSARLKINPLLLEGTQDPAAFAGTVSTIIDWSFSQAADAKLKRLAAQRMLASHPGVLHNDFLACQNFDLTDRVGYIRCPTLILCGTEDKMTPLRMSQFLVDRIPKAHLEVLPLAGHMLMLEQPVRTAAIIRDFLTSATEY